MSFGKISWTGWVNKQTEKLKPIMNGVEILDIKAWQTYKYKH